MYTVSVSNSQEPIELGIAPGQRVQKSLIQSQIISSNGRKSDLLQLNTKKFTENSDALFNAGGVIGALLI